MRVKIQIDTTTSAAKLSSICSTLPGNISITDATGLKVNAKSVLGALYSMEFSELWLESENDIYTAIKEFVVF